MSTKLANRYVRGRAELLYYQRQPTSPFSKVKNYGCICKTRHTCLYFQSHLKEFPLLDCTSIRPRIRDPRFSQLKLTRNASNLLVIRAQNSPVPDYIPESKFYKVEAVLRPWRVQKVSSALLEMGIRGVTVSDVRGFGAQGGSTERHGGPEFSGDMFVAKTKMEIVVSKDQVEAVIEKILEEARTGEIGDGKIFCERGEKAEKMTEGQSEMRNAA